MGLQPDPLIQDIKEAKIKIDLPNSEWFLADKVEKNDLVVYMFKREPIEDKEQRQIIPNIAVIVEDVDENLDVIRYSVIKRSQTPFDVDEVITPQSGKILFTNAIGYRGHYKKNELHHTIYIVHAINDGKGIHVIMDVTTNILDKVDVEFLSAIKSIRR